MSSEKNNKKKGRISDNIVDEIKKNEVKMKPSCYFVFSSFLWFGIGAIFFIISLILLGFSVHYFYEYKILELILMWKFSGWFLSPILMGLIGIVFIYISSRFYRKGRICCRHEEWMLLSAIGLIVVIGLFALANSGPFENWRDTIEEKEVNQKFIISSQRFWSDNDAGRVFGEIVDLDKKGGYVLIKQDKGDKIFKLNTSSCGCKINHDTAKKGELIKSTGEIDDQNFQAQQIWYWE